MVLGDRRGRLAGRHTRIAAIGTKVKVRVTIPRVPKTVKKKNKNPLIHPGTPDPRIYRGV